MLIPQWFAITMDKRGSINLPAQIKGLCGFQHGSVFYVRSVGDVFMVVPFERVKTAISDLQRDLATAAHINASWDPKAAVVPPLVAAEAPVAPPLPAREDAVWESQRIMVHMNKKGFIPTPDLIKEQLRLARGDIFLISVQVTPGGKTVIVLEPTASVSGALTQHLEKERARHLADEKRESSIALYEQKIKELEEYEQQLCKKIKEAEQQVARNRTQVGVFHAGQPSRTIEQMGAAPAVPFPFPLSPPAINIPPKPDTPPEEGMTWKYNPAVGWVQVDIVD